MNFSWQRLWAVILKEFIQMKRDRLTFAMIIGIPLMQLILFGFAINDNPKNLPTVVVAADHSYFTRDIVVALQNSSYFKILPDIKGEKAAEKMLSMGDIQFIIYFPPNFTEQLIHGNKPEVLVEVDATDPAATSFALSAVQNLNSV